MADPFYDTLPTHSPSFPNSFSSRSRVPESLSPSPVTPNAFSERPFSNGQPSYPPGTALPYNPALAEATESVASSLTMHGYPSPPTPTLPPYRSDYASSLRALNQPPLLYDHGDPLSPYTDESKSGTPMIPLGRNPRRGSQFSEKNSLYAPRTRRSCLWWCAVVAIVVLILAAAALVAVYFFIIRPHSSSSSSSSPSSSHPSSSPAQPAPPFTGAVTGGDGSTVTMDNGTTFTYNNPFGGYWFFDPSDPFNDGAQAQEWTPALNETWNWGVDQIRGVNIGGWLVTEPFIVPNLYEPYQSGAYPAIDEWTLTVAMSQTGNATALMEQHYSTFITEQDFAQIAAAGLNWVRIPLPYWAIEVYDGEPFVPHLAWTYFLKAIQWARKYGLRINMDLHTIPGSQNGWNHSGKLGPVNFLFGVMGIANAQRALSYIRTLTEFISQPQYMNVVPMFGIVNEPLSFTTGMPQLQSFYLEAYDMIRNITGTGAGQGPFISIHEGFRGLDQWASFLSGADRLALDMHPYVAFNAPSSGNITSFFPAPCTSWGPQMNTSMQAFGFSAAGEWSQAINDCGKWVNGVGLGTRYEGTYQGSEGMGLGSCDPWNDWPAWNDTIKADLQTFAMATMDSLQNWFFWTWKIHPSSITNKVESPFWSYSLGLEQGWLPADPRSALGYCSSALDIPMPSALPSPPLSAWQTGGAGAGSIAPTALASVGPWPIESMTSIPSFNYIPPQSVALLPQYTPTGAPITLPGPTFTKPASTQTADAGSGWADEADTGGYYVPIQGCAYPNPWDAVNASVPLGGACLPTGTGAGKARRSGRGAPMPVRTAPPVV